MALSYLQSIDFIVTLVTIAVVLTSSSVAYLKITRVKKTFTGSLSSLLTSFQLINVFFTLCLVGYFLLRLAHESYSILGGDIYSESAIFLNFFIDGIILVCSLGIFVAQSSLANKVEEMSFEYGFNEVQKKRVLKKIRG